MSLRCSMGAKILVFVDDSNLHNRARITKQEIHLTANSMTTHSVSVAQEAP